jgi:Ca2+-binding RTX toxin-like protein
MKGIAMRLPTILTSTAVAGVSVLLFSGPALAQNIHGTGGDDHLTGTSAADTMHGRGGDDVIEGLGGRDLLDGGRGADRLLGGPGGDFFHGGPGNDVVRAGSGNDQLETIQGADRIFMGAGNDSLSFLTDDAKVAVIDCGRGHDVVNYLGAIDTDDVISTNCEEVSANTSD